MSLMAHLRTTLDAMGEEFLRFIGPRIVDQRITRDWFGADFSFAVAVTSLYTFLVIFGFALMSMPFMPKIKPRFLQFIYNPLQVILCSYMTVEAGLLAYRSGYSIVPCNPYNITNPPLANLLWLFYMSKILDFFDTFFIILAKDWKRLSFLHVYHHITIFLMYWLNLNVGYDGDIYLTIVLNGFIHTIMYDYYFMAMHTPDIWWKKYLTSMQMIQFILMNAQAIFIIATGCDEVPLRLIKLYLAYIFSLLVLFYNFYRKSYSSGAKKQKPQKTD